MSENISIERWRDVDLGQSGTDGYRLQVSNLGNLRTFNQHREGAPLSGATINGYRIIRIKLLKPKVKKVQQTIAELQGQLRDLRQHLKSLKTTPNTAVERGVTQKLIAKKQLALSAERAKDRLARTINYHSLFHRLVAAAFVTPKSPSHSVVGHLDHNKLNNVASNLQWMTPEENYRHQQLSPNVIREKKERRTLYKDHPRNGKLTAPQVAQIKKALKENKTAVSLAKKFKITDTQILRIKKGINWAHVKPAK